MKVVELHNPKTLCIRFDFSYDMVNKVKTLAGHRWWPNGKYWTASNIDINKQFLKDWGFTFDKMVEDHTKSVKALTVDEIETTATLRPYQIEGINFFHAHNGSILLADEQGLGKTVQTVSYINSAQKFPCLIIVPASLKYNWAKEITKWTKDKNIYICSGREANTSSSKLRKYHWIICNYDILTSQAKNSWFATFMDVAFRMMVLDESQNIKNDESKRTKSILKLAQNIESRTCLSGTPISNRPMEFFTTFKLVYPELFPNKYAFGRRYCGPKNNGYGTTYNGATNIDELNRILTGTFMLRRLKSDVLKELPEKQKIVVPVLMDDEYQKEYRKAAIDFIRFLRDSGKDTRGAENAEAIVRLNGLRKLAMQGKLNSCIEWIEEFLESGKKLVVFAWHKEAVDALMDKFGKIAVKIDGSVSANMRQEAVDAFQNNENIKLFVGNIKAAGTGITLTAASDTCTIELSWSPSDLAQAEDRVHRIGQKNAVSNYYLLADGTIDDDMMTLIDEKKKIIDMVMDGKETEDESLFNKLMNKYRNEAELIENHYLNFNSNNNEEDF